MQTELQKQLSHWYGACDPARPLVLADGDTAGTYVDFDGWLDSTTGQRVSLRGTNPPMRRLLTAIQVQQTEVGESTFLFAGFRGAGKTTELQRLAAKLADDFAVLYVDAGAYAGILSDRPGIVEFSLALLAAIGARAAEEFGEDIFGKSKFWDIVEKFLTAEVTSIGADISGFQIQAALKGNPSFRSLLQQAFDHRPEAMRDFVHQKVAQIARAAGRPLVILVDGLEKPNAQLGSVGEVYRYLAKLYVGHADWLRFPKVHTVFCVPPLVPVLSPGIDSAYSPAVQALPSVKMQTRPPEREYVRAAEEAMTEVLVRRGIDLDLLFGQEREQATQELVRRSGGHVRHLLEDTRVLLLEAWDRELPVSAEFVADVLKAQHSRYNISTSALGRLLVRIDEGGTLTELDNQEIEALAWALDQYLILSYANGESWYDVHPRAHVLLREARRHAVAARGDGEA